MFIFICEYKLSEEEVVSQVTLYRNRLCIQDKQCKNIRYNLCDESNRFEQKFLGSNNKIMYNEIIKNIFIVKGYIGHLNLDILLALSPYFNKKNNDN